jgi:hypothetical protein
LSISFLNRCLYCHYHVPGSKKIHIILQAHYISGHNQQAKSRCHVVLNSKMILVMLPVRKARGRTKRHTSIREEAHEHKRSSREHILTQKRRCLYYFENPSRPKHLVVAIGNFTYLMLPQFEPVVPRPEVILTFQVTQFTICCSIDERRLASVCSCFGICKILWILLSSL